ncbi:aldehyde dehydrogenase (NADP(+)) [Calycomorphotria hydatis]|uniref:NADP-dependent fatty aldehyde dehydrogenase n=1 Tax=Calycomorphotria hydatis TaxID=2528027 RepID=A0A517T7Y0_9PLAN|nr:aldehyde dehydrogenase (NADP(+)) [Calycomorphotria hydatis]QDT64483.1 NADP-dependent fatty aldehyde dehydrogenase [Calycomorphotria hydatis]
MSAPVLVAGEWINSVGKETFQAINPSTTEPLEASYPISPWSEIDAVLNAAVEAAPELREAPAPVRANFLDRFADRIDEAADEIVELAHAETGLPVTPRLKAVELPRTSGQLRQAAEAARSGSWAMPTIDSATNIRSVLEPLGPVVTFAPNNFPFAINAAAGCDLASAIAVGAPLIAKGHPSHPGTTKRFAELALEVLKESELPEASIQLLYHMSPEDGLKLVADPRVGATSFTGSRAGGLALKAAADAVGNPIYLEMSSINPVFILPGALDERIDAIANEFGTSCLMGAGQFCTNPGIVVLPSGEYADAFLDNVCEHFRAAPVSTMLNKGVQTGCAAAIEKLIAAGAELVVGGSTGGGKGFCYENTILRVSAEKFLSDPEAFQTEAFGNTSLFVFAASDEEMLKIAESCEGNLTGCIYSHGCGEDDRLYDVLEPVLRQRVGRLLNDKMPTGVAVSPAMNHGGPYPASGHPGFTSIGIPASLQRFAKLTCYDNVRPHRLPALLKDENPLGAWRYVDGRWTQLPLT